MDPVEIDFEAAFHRGEDVACEKLPFHLFAPGVKVVGEKCNYGGEEVGLAGKVVKVEIEGSAAELILHPTGTTAESLIKFVTGLEVPRVRLHLCAEGCDQLRTNPNLLHCKKLHKSVPGKELAWEDNLVVTDEVPLLRRDHEAWRGDQVAPKGDESSSSRGKKKKKKEKKKREKKKAEEKTKKMGGRSVAQKPLAHLYAGTGMDPDFGDRRRLLKKVKRRLRKSKETSSSGSTGSSSSSEDAEINPDLLQDRSKIQRVAEMAPGILSSEAIRAMKRHVMMAAGQPWELDQQTLPPITCQYARQFMMGRATPPIQREVATLSHVIDLLAMGRAAQALDTATQRLKSIELTLQGHSWQAAQKVEVIDSLDAQLATRAEIEVAQKEMRLDQKSKGSGGGTSSWEKGGTKGKSAGKGKDRGKNEKGKNAQKTDGKKGS